MNPLLLAAVALGGYLWWSSKKAAPTAPVKVVTPSGETDGGVIPSNTPSGFDASEFIVPSLGALNLKVAPGNSSMVYTFNGDAIHVTTHTLSSLTGTPLLQYFTGKGSVYPHFIVIVDQIAFNAAAAGTGQTATAWVAGAQNIASLYALYHYMKVSNANLRMMSL